MITLSVLGRPVGLRVDPPLHAHLASALRDLASGASASTESPTIIDVTTDGRTWRVVTDRQRYAGPSADLAFYDTLCAVNDLAAATIARIGGVGLHGGAVAIESADGPAGLAIVGASGAGKSTMTARLVLDGHAYIGDEVAAVTPRLRLAGFHRPIGLRQSSVGSLQLVTTPGPYEFTTPFVASDAATLADDVPLVAIALPMRDAAGPAKEPITPADALTRLCNATLGTQRLEREAFGRLDRLVRSVPAALVRYRDLSAGAAACVELVSCV